MQETETRNSDGTFKKGISGNPAGINAPKKGWQPYGNRVSKLLEKYSAQQILTIANDEYLLREQSSIDAIAIVHIARALDKNQTQTTSGSDDVRGERKELLDRIEGQSKATIALQGGDDDANPIRTDLTVSDAAKLYAETMKNLK